MGSSRCISLYLTVSRCIHHIPPYPAISRTRISRTNPYSRGVTRSFVSILDAVHTLQSRLALTPALVHLCTTGRFSAYSAIDAIYRSPGVVCCLGPVECVEVSTRSVRSVVCAKPSAFSKLHGQRAVFRSPGNPTV
jgi:hypothetical protein